MKRKRGFTLVELSAVMVLLAIFAAIVGISLRGRVEKVRFASVADRLETLDRQTRDRARKRQRQLGLRIDTANNSFAQWSPMLAGPNKKISLSRGIEIDRLWTPRSGSTGRAEISVSTLGQSETYAVRLSSASGRQLWLLVCGLTGQAVRLESDEEIESLFRLPSAARADAG